jgi:hypothetical protein
MTAGRKAFAWIVPIVVTCAALIAVHATKIWRHRRAIFLQGAVIQQDVDPRRQVPVPDVEITAATDLDSSEGHSDSSGFFSLPLPSGATHGQHVRLVFMRAGFHPLSLDEIVDDKLIVARMTAIPHIVNPVKEVVVANVRVRYSVNTTSVENVGSAVKTFQVANVGNVPCKGQTPCSPDGKWKAAIGSVSLDAGQNNEFWNVRVSCIAGPCPFTKVDSTRYSQNSRELTIKVLDWSDTATFLLQSEVVRPLVSDVVRGTYPVIFGEDLNFTVPSGAEGVTMEAELDGQSIVFPLGPDTILSWADCRASVNPDQTKVYRCVLDSGYRFQ